MPEGKPDQPEAPKGSGAPKADDASAGGSPGEFEKKPKLSKQERRELQEAQRAAKASKGGAPAPAAKPAAAPKPAAAAAGGGGPPERTSSAAGKGATAAADGAAAKAGPDGKAEASAKGEGGAGKGSAGLRLHYDDPKAMAKAKRHQVVQRTEGQKKVAWFSHLPQYEREASLSSQLARRADSDIHPEVLKVGLKFADWLVVGGNSRTVAMLEAFAQVVKDYVPAQGHDTGADLSRHLDSRLKPMISYLVACRPLSVGMGNAIRWLKAKIAHIPPTQNMQEAKERLCLHIEGYIYEHIDLADRIISGHGASKLNNDDVVLVYARSSAVEAVLLKARADGTKFRVIVVDSRPKFEGKQLLKRLHLAGVDCTYIMINALSYVMKEVTKVLLGASGLLSNGHVISRVGTATVAMMAHTCRVPVLVCCETYKFSEKVMLDSICNNELGDPDELQSGQSGSSLSEWRDVPTMKLLNLVYDLTPIDFVTLVITELGNLPPTSVPVVIREYRKEVTL